MDSWEERVGFELNRLSAIGVKNTVKPGRYGDGGGLWLQVSPSGGKSWLMRYMINGRAREMGLGPLHSVSLAEARRKAEELRRQLHEGIDPIEARDARLREVRLSDAKVMTFGECGRAYIAAHQSSWRNPKHAQQWGNTLQTYVYPLIGDLPVNQIGVDLVIKVLEPVWQTKPETGSRIRMRIETILAWATAREFRSGENPARWRGHLDQLLPPRRKVKKVQHHPALPYREIGDFMAKLAESDSVAARALEFTILTACRTSEAIGAKRSEFDLDKGIWVIPGDRMKAGREHRVALSDRAIEIVKSSMGDGDIVFPGGAPGRPLSNMAMLKLLARMKRDDITVHGFRSTFRDWCAEKTNYPREVAEMALAHAVGDKTEAAYRRGDLFEKRRRLAEDWARYCGTRSSDLGNVVQIRAQSND